MANYDFYLTLFSAVESIKPRPDLTLEEVSLDNRDTEALDNFLNSN